jgi:hypothetical protein
VFLASVAPTTGISVTGITGGSVDHNTATAPTTGAASGGGIAAANDNSATGDRLHLTAAVVNANTVTWGWQQQRRWAVIHPTRAGCRHPSRRQHPQPHQRRHRHRRRARAIRCVEPGRWQGQRQPGHRHRCRLPGRWRNLRRRLGGAGVVGRRADHRQLGQGHPTAQGDGVYTIGGASGLVSGTRITGNTATGHTKAGGGIYNTDGGQDEIDPTSSVDYNRPDQCNADTTADAVTGC